METWFWVLLIVALTAAVAYIWLLAVRIDRLHRRLLRSSTGLQIALIKRAATSVQLATADVLNPAQSAVLLEAANDALSRVEEPLAYLPGQDPPDGAAPRYAVESRLSEVLRELGESPALRESEGNSLGSLIWGELDEIRYRVQVGRILYNQDVTLVHELRDRPSAKLFRLAGFAAMPEYIDMDDNV